LAGCYGSLGETEHVRAQSMLSTALAFVWRQFAIGVNLSLESS
jgi:hypothetical protein